MSEKRLSTSSNDFVPLPLCRRCQEWGQISIHNVTYGDIMRQGNMSTTTIREYVSIEQLTQSPLCYICTSVLNIYYMRSQVIPHLQFWPDRCIIVEISGPFYLDIGKPSSGGIICRRPDLSHPNCILIKMFLKLEVKTLPCENLGGGEEEPCLTRRVGQVDVPSKVASAPTQFVTTPQFIMRYSKETVPVLCSIKEWEVPFFYIQVLKGWLDSCSKLHGKQCVGEKDESGTLPTGFRVIDTHGMRITKPDGFVRYVALSYMWSAGSGSNIQLEKSNVNALEAEDSLRTLPIPDVIADAIALCRDLGERFLWVDRLCIVQDDQYNKPGQINAMDKIYHLATFTIIAALNTRDGVGLPGFVNRPRHPRSSVWAPPHAEEVEAQGFDAEEIIGNVVDTSLWNKRGWTFQERLLSKRRIFITEHQIIYECCEGQATELLIWNGSMTYEHESPRELTSPTQRSGPPFNQGQQTSSDLQHIDDALGFYIKSEYASNSYVVKESASIRDYCDWVKDYSSRQFSFGTDTLNAFAGVGNALGAALGTQMLYGLPEKYLTQSLLWSTSSVVRRGKTYDIPSWSWASWPNPVCFDSRDRNKRFLEIASLVYLYYQDPDVQRLRKLDTEETWIQNKITIEEISKRDELPVLTGKHNPGEWRSNRDWRDCPQNPWEAFERQSLNQDACMVAVTFPGSLVFNTTVASLSIDHLRHDDSISTEYKLSNASLYDKSGEAVGVLGDVEYGWIEVRRGSDSNKLFFDFIVISGRLVKHSIRSYFRLTKTWDECWLLDVMLVHRFSCKPFVARRVAVGTVKLYKWKGCDPRWETVVLC